jgi:hypothetical protein
MTREPLAQPLLQPSRALSPHPPAPAHCRSFEAGDGARHSVDQERHAPSGFNGGERVEAVCIPGIQAAMGVLDSDSGSARKRQPESHRNHPKAKLLKRVTDLVLVEIPRDPNAAEFQLGNTLGPVYRHCGAPSFSVDFGYSSGLALPPEPSSMRGSITKLRFERPVRVAILMRFSQDVSRKATHRTIGIRCFGKRNAFSETCGETLF